MAGVVVGEVVGVVVREDVPADVGRATFVGDVNIDPTAAVEVRTVNATRAAWGPVHIRDIRHRLCVMQEKSPFSVDRGNKVVMLICGSLELT